MKTKLVFKSVAARSREAKAERRNKQLRVVDVILRLDPVALFDHSHNFCRKQCKSNNYFTFYCTRPKGHLGSHVAHYYNSRDPKYPITLCDIEPWND